jgi:hypothetical protein
VTDRPSGELIAAVVADAGVRGPRAALAAAARSLAAAGGVTLDETSLRLFDGLATARESPGRAAGIGAGPADPGLLGRCLEALLTDDQRKRGAHHTPAPVAERIVALVLDGVDGRGVAALCDPAVGGGVFLLAAADRLHRDGLDRAEVLDRLWGFDLDPLAVAVTETALALWAGATTTGRPGQLVVGDFLGREVATHRPARGWSIIVGNPPFQSQLGGRTARDRDRSQALRDRFGPEAGGYVDTAGLFAMAGVEHLAERGRLALVLPASLLAAAAAAPMRRAAVGVAPVRDAWVPDRQPFGAAVDVAVPVLERGRPRPVGLHVGAEIEPTVVPNPGPDWSALLAAAEGVPAVDLEGAAGVVGDLAAATAGFRQHFYGLRGAVHEAAGSAGRPLLTAGLVDPLTSHWGRRGTRVAGTTYRAPVVDADAVEDRSVAAWLADRRRPKALVATQTRVLEVLVDPTGAMVPSTPVISVEPHDPTDLWRLAAVLCAPPVTAWFHRLGAGGGLSPGRIRPTARQIRALPLPGDGPGWQAGAVLARRASQTADPGERRELLIELGAAMTAAYGADPAVTAWWRGLLPAPTPPERLDGGDTRGG